MKHVTAVLLAALVLLAVCSSAAGQDFMTVGTEISPETITDFYWTYDAPIDPPVYLRYHFRAADGAYTFTREVREGDHWPLTEADITASDTRTLTEEEWAAFLGLLLGGTVTKPEDNLLDGDAGPWTYIDWAGDQDGYRAFSFPTGDDSLTFEAFCETLASGGTEQTAE